MEWILSSEFTIVETKTGFVIYLLSGTWSQPADIKTNAPKGMGVQEQAKYLRLGLGFANEFMINRLTYTACA